MALNVETAALRRKIMNLKHDAWNIMQCSVWKQIGLLTHLFCMFVCVRMHGSKQHM
jgi:hypothetical protein